MIRVVSVLFLPFLAASLAAKELAVPGEFATIQAAVDGAAAGDRVVLAIGVHSGPGNCDVDFRGKAITVTSADPSAPSVIDCEGASRAFRFATAEGPDALLLGLVIRNGSAADNGGAILCEGSSPTIQGCELLSNRAVLGGGAIVCLAGAGPHVIGCLFEQNQASLGGAIHADASSPRVERCTFVRNQATNGAGLYGRQGAAFVVLRSTFATNRAGYGAGIYVDRSSPTIEDSSFVGGRVSAAGGALFVYAGSDPVLRRCSMVGNSAEGTAGGICFLGGSKALVENCLFAGNFAFRSGAISCETVDDTPTLLHVTVAHNGADTPSGGIACDEGAVPRVFSSIVWGNEPESICGAIEGTVFEEDPRFARSGRFDFSRFRDAAIGGQSYAMPDFVVEAGDYRLAADSPAVGAALGEGAPGDDLDGNVRPCFGSFDAGAFERCPGPATQLRRGDANADGAADLSDAVFTLNYLFLGVGAPACLDALDIDDNGVGEITDPIALLGSLFLGTADPSPPFTACGLDASDDSLDCARFVPCE